MSLISIVSGCEQHCSNLILYGLFTGQSASLECNLCHLTDKHTLTWVYSNQDVGELQAHAEACLAIGHAELAGELLEMNGPADDTILQDICYALADTFFPRYGFCIHVVADHFKQSVQAPS